MKTVVNNLKFRPLISFNKFGNEIQRCETKYKRYNIIMETYIPFNIFKDPIDTFMVDIIVPSNIPIKNATINVNIYTEEGFGYPIFKTLEHAIRYINTL